MLIWDNGILNRSCHKHEQWGICLKVRAHCLIFLSAVKIWNIRQRDPFFYSTLIRLSWLWSEDRRRMWYIWMEDEIVNLSCNQIFTASLPEFFPNFKKRRRKKDEGKRAVIHYPNGSGSEEVCLCTFLGEECMSLISTHGFVNV